MGAQSSLLGLVSAASVGAGMLSRNLGKNNQRKENVGVTSEANDADKNELMRLKAEYQMEKLKQIKLQNKNIRLKNRIEKQTLKKMQEVKPDEQK